MTPKEFSTRISQLSQELIETVAEFNRTQISPINEANTCFLDAVSFFDADLASKNEKLAGKKAVAQRKLACLIQETENAKASLNRAIQNGDVDAEVSATAKLNDLAAQQFASTTLQNALNSVEVRGSEELYHDVLNKLRELHEAYTGRRSSEYGFCFDTIRATANKMLELCRVDPHADIMSVALMHSAERTAFRVFEATEGHVDLSDICNAGDDNDKKRRVVHSLLEGRTAPGLENTAVGKRLDAIFAEQYPTPKT